MRSDFLGYKGRCYDGRYCIFNGIIKVFMNFFIKFCQNIDKGIYNEKKNLKVN